MADIVITEFIDAGAVDVLEASYDVQWDPELWSKRAELERAIAGVPALIVRNRTKVDAALLDLAPRLKVVGRLGVGLDNIDVAHAGRRGVEVVTARGANATSVAEYVIATALTLLRGPAYRGTELLAAGQWPREAFGRGRELAGKTIGIVGFNSIGATTARKARALDMGVVAHDPFLDASNENWNIARSATLDTLLAESDVVSLHCPLTPQTRGMLGARQLRAMKPGSILINTARGGIVDHGALAAALRDGHLAGAAIDVFEDEPITAAEAGLLQGVPNLILTPHISGVTVESNRRVSFMTAEAVAAVLARTRRT